MLTYALAVPEGYSQRFTRVSQSETYKERARRVRILASTEGPGWPGGPVRQRLITTP